MAQTLSTMPLSTTPLNVSRIAYGCMLIGGSWERATPLTEQNRREALAALRAALECGINFFDHADIYCAGKSEEAFSQLWRESPGLREKIIVQSKCGIRFENDPAPGLPGRYDFSYEHIVRSVEGSLKRLQTDYLDLLLLHRPDALVEPEEVARAFDDLQTSGKVRYFGVSNHTAAQIAFLQSALDQPLVVNQVELSLLHTHLIDAGIVFNQDDPPALRRNEGTLEYCRQHNITLQAWGPLASGAVLGVGESLSEAARQTAAVVHELARAKQVRPEAIAIAWLLRHPAHIQPIIGTTKPERIRAACEADRVELTREEWYRLFIAGRGGRLP
jgi:predicted oxidoreductase